MNEDLLKVLSDQLDCKSSNSKIINLEPLTGGASKEIWKFEIQSELAVFYDLGIILLHFS